MVKPEETDNTFEDKTSTNGNCFVNLDENDDEGDGAEFDFNIDMWKGDLVKQDEEEGKKSFFTFLFILLY